MVWLCDATDIAGLEFELAAGREEQGGEDEVDGTRRPDTPEG